MPSHGQAHIKHLQLLDHLRLNYNSRCSSDLNMIFSTNLMLLMWPIYQTSMWSVHAPKLMHIAQKSTLLHFLHTSFACYILKLNFTMTLQPHPPFEISSNIILHHFPTTEYLPHCCHPFFHHSLWHKSCKKLYRLTESHILLCIGFVSNFNTTNESGPNLPDCHI